MLNNIMNSQKPNNYVRRRFICMDEYITKLEIGEETIPVSSGVLEWKTYQTILTAFIRINCSEGDAYFNPKIHSYIMDVFGDRLYKWYKNDAK
jgi:hypothetical protein